MTEIRILIAEDHLIARVGVKTIINAQPDMTVVAEAANGLQAVELFRKHRPDVSLMDVRMPEMNGVAATQAIRAEFPQAHIIALSTYGVDSRHPRRAFGRELFAGRCCGGARIEHLARRFERSGSGSAGSDREGLRQ
jgi:chemotaxis response regulator CheB